MCTRTAVEIGAAYIRVSTDDQTELSPDAQLRVILDAAKADGFVIPKEYIFMEKRGISGRKADNRPEFQRMIALAKSQHPAPFQRLYLWKFSRFARNQDESTFYKGILRKKCGVEIKSVSEPIADGMFGRLIETIIEWFDEYYSYNLSGEVLRGMKEKALRHGYQTTPCLGYDAVGEGKPHVINESAYAIASFIHQYYHDGHDPTAVARECNRRGYRTRRGNLFERRGIVNILQNRFYIGIVSWNGIEFTGSHETRPAITDIFEENQKRLDQEYRPLKRREVSTCRHWLSGLLICGYCGASLYYCASKNQKKRPDAFQCWKYSKGFHPESCSISVKKAESLVLASLQQVLESGELTFEYVPRPDESIDAEKAFLEAALSRLSQKELRIRDAYENGIDTLEEYKSNKERLSAEYSHLQMELEQLASQAPKAPSLAVQKAAIMQNIHSAYDLLSDPDVDYEIKGAALRRIVKKIVYRKEEKRFEFYYYV